MNNNNDNAPLNREEADSGITISPVNFQPAGKINRKKTFRLDLRTVLVSSGLLLCAAAALFLFSARAVYIEVQPAGARIEINSLLKLRLADRYLLLSGSHNLEMEAEGYYPGREELIVTDQADQHFLYTLERLPGHLQIDTGEVSGAEIYVDDELSGSTPTTVRDIKPGDHQLRIVAERYFPLEENIEIEGLDRLQTLSVELVPAWAEVSFDSQPPGAEILVDDEPVGKTPFTAEILEGRRQLRVKLSGHKAWEKAVMVRANEPLDFSGITLEPADALVFLATEPPRASVTLDGEYQGLSPLELTLQPGKSSRISLFKQGYQSSSRTLKVASGKEERLRVRLKPELVEVEFRLEPRDARLYINGEVQADGKRVIPLSAKSHRIEVRRDGYVSYETKITPRDGVSQVVDVVLKSERQAKLEKIKPLYRTSAGQSMKLLYPGGFTMGASRREPGRRANETLREIKLKRPFYLSLHEVTNAQFRKFRPAHDSGTVQGRTVDNDEQPVVNITWNDAARYCNWLSAAESLTPFYIEDKDKIIGANPAAEGYRLPSEAEWAWAARVVGKDQLLKFPWGDKMPPTGKSGNFADTSTSGFLGRTLAGYNDGYLASAKVGSFPANAKGFFDMGGNVAEWVHDFYDIQLPGGRVPVDPLGPETGEFHVIRGSSWAHGTVTELRLSYRDYHAKSRDDVGFRIARYLE